MLDQLPTASASIPSRRYDAAATFGLCAIAVAHRFAWANSPPDVDPINFTLALERYSVPEIRPHAPGYPLFVLAGRHLAAWVGPAHAYQLVNLALLLATAVLVYRMLRPYSPCAGLASALAFAAHPLALAATVVADVYVTDAFFATAIAACVLAARRTIGLLALPLPFLGLGLTRPVSCAMLLPLAIVGVAVVRWPAWRKPALFAAAGSMLATTTAVLVTVQLAGGYQAYTTASDIVMGQSFRSSSVLGGAPLRAHASMALGFAAWFLVLAVPGVLGGVIAARRQRREVLRSYLRALTLAALWVVPPVLFYLAIYYVKPTHQLIYLPCIVIGVGTGAAVLLRRASHVSQIAAVLAVAGAMLAAFWFAPSSLPRPLHRLTRAYPRAQDSAWSQLQAQMRTIERSPRTLLVWDRDPLLTVYALRLLRWPGPTAAIADAGVALLDLRTMDWSPALRPDDPLPAGIDRVAIVGGAARVGAACSAALPTGARGAWLLDWLAQGERRRRHTAAALAAAH